MTTHPEADEARIRSLLIAAGVGPLADHHPAPDATVDADPAPDTEGHDGEPEADNQAEAGWRARLLRLTERIEETAGVTPPTRADADEDHDDEGDDGQDDEDEGDGGVPAAGANRMPDWRTGAHIDLTKPAPDDPDGAPAKTPDSGGADEDADQDDATDADQDTDAEDDLEAGLPWWQRTAGRLERKAGVEPPSGTEPPPGPGGGGGGGNDAANDDVGDDDSDPAAKKVSVPSRGGGTARFWPSWGSGRRPKFDAPGLDQDRRTVLDIIRSVPRHFWWLLYSGSAAAVGWHFGWPQWVSDALLYLETTQASWTTIYCLTCYALAVGVLAADVATRRWFYPLAWAVRVLSASLVLGFLLWGDPTPISDLVNSSERTTS